MTDSISRSMFDHLVDLAALELTPAEADYLLQQMNNQLKSIAELIAIPLDEDTPIASHGVPYRAEMSAPLRLDVIHPCQNVDEILAQAPQVQERYIIVPDIPHATLE
jgi:aspartyl/glutamyl-tRNA(Asn/Gln) amidotransferase C subunit